MLETECAQPYYYIDSTYQLELNLQELRREIIEYLDLIESAECTTCTSLKCHCSLPDKSKQSIELNESTDRQAAAFEYFNYKESTDIGGMKLDIWGSKAEDQISLNKNFEPENIHCKNVNTERYNPTVVMSPPPSSLPRPEWDTETSLSTTSPVHFKEVENWIKSSTFENNLLNKSQITKPKVVSEVDLNRSWPPLPAARWCSENEAQYRQVSIDALFRSFQRPVYTTVNQYVNAKLAPTFMYKMKITSKPQNSILMKKL